MKGSECKFVKYMEGADKRFVIPVYQRNYDWKKENCEQLYDDLIKIIQNGRKSHFFGSLVSVYNSDAHHEEYLVIDGQQRLTTISLLFLAMYNLIEQEVIIPQSANLKQRIYDEYLVDKYQPEDTRIKLKPVKNDQRAYGLLFTDESERVRESNVTINYNYFYNRIQQQEINIDQLFSAICCLEIINIRLEPEDNPQLIFESLNSTGLDLSEGDKIRNFILMGLPTQEQNRYYEKYWNKIELHTKYEVSAFIRDYLSVKEQAIPAQKKVYTTFKNYTDRKNLQAEELLTDMLAYAKRYETLLNGKPGNNALNACIYRLNRLETTVTRPFFLEVLRFFDEGKLTIQQVTQIFLLAENYLFRRSICDLPTNALNKIFLTLHAEIIRYDKSEDNYVEKLKYAFLSKKEKSRFPDDDEFAHAFATRQIYLMNSKNKVYILERLENFGTAEDKDVYRHCDDGSYSIEHVMPQHLTPTWQNELGESYEHIHENWLHRIANLTLTAYNSQYSNRPFTEKKTTAHGFNDSGIRMNTWIAKKNKWTLEELEARSELLTSQALNIWAAPITNYKPAEKQLDSFTLDDDDSLLTGRLIARFCYKNTDQPATSWADMYMNVLQLLYSEDKSIITKLATSNDEGLAMHFSLNKDEFNRYSEIEDGIYVWTNTSTQSKLSILNRLFALYAIDPGDLVFFLRDDNDTSYPDEAARHTRRRAYWAYALEFIRKAHPNNAYDNLRTTKSNWLNLNIGIQGVYLGCVANRDEARVELYISKHDIQENKLLFDKLHLSQSAIEAKLGIPLEWSRGEELKSSKISYSLKHVSIENEADWQQMAQFHATWSKKFFDTFTPYLQDSILI